MNTRSTNRSDILAEKLDKSISRSIEFFSNLDEDQWHQVLYVDPPWSVYNVLLHLVSAEQQLLVLIRAVTTEGTDIGDNFNLDDFNQSEQERMPLLSKDEYMNILVEARQKTIEFARTLTDQDLDRIGRHPRLGMVSVETMLNAVWGHHLIHIREIREKIRN